MFNNGPRDWYLGELGSGSPNVILKAYYGEQQGRPTARLRPDIIVFTLKAYYGEQQGRPTASLGSELVEFILKAYGEQQGQTEARIHRVYMKVPLAEAAESAPGQIEARTYNFHYKDVF